MDLDAAGISCEYIYELRRAPLSTPAFEVDNSIMLGLSWILLSVLAATGARAGEVVWDGSFNNFASAADFDKCQYSSMLPNGLKQIY